MPGVSIHPYCSHQRAGARRAIALLQLSLLPVDGTAHLNKCGAGREAVGIVVSFLEVLIFHRFQFQTRRRKHTEGYD